MSKMIETNVDPKLMISKLKNVKEKVEEMGTEGSLDKDLGTKFRKSQSSHL